LAAGPERGGRYGGSGLVQVGQVSLDRDSERVGPAASGIAEAFGGLRRVTGYPDRAQSKRRTLV
jgi:hypothetical protein